MTSATIVRNLRDRRVVVIHPRDRDGEDLSRQLQRIGCQVQAIWPPPASLPSPVDVVFVSLDREQAVAMPWRTESDAAVIAVLDYENPTTLKALLDANAHGVLIRPVRPVGVLSTLVLALSLKGYETRLNHKVAKLEETLRTRREIEKATRLLMKLRNLGEDEAYQFMRKQATAKRVPVAAIATSIIHAADLLGDMRLDHSPAEVTKPAARR
ncbi:MAG: ANTAR domain-containing protein [Alsobacter sp.]